MTRAAASFPSDRARGEQVASRGTGDFVAIARRPPLPDGMRSLSYVALERSTRSSVQGEVCSARVR